MSPPDLQAARSAATAVALGLGPALLVGIAVQVLGGAPASRWAVNAAAGALGIALGAGIGALGARASRALPALAVLGVLAIAATLLTEGAQGVRRWLEVGALRPHPSALLTPLVLAGAVALAGRARPWAAWALVLATQALHVAQPDAGQASALALGALVAGLGPRRFAAAGSVAALALAALAWCRPDPLGPADFVEDILVRASALHPAWALLGVASLGWLVVAPLVGRGVRRAHAVVATAYLAASVAAPAFGELPVPVLGFGASPILGAALCLALAAAGRSDGEASVRAPRPG